MLLVEYKTSIVASFRPASSVSRSSKSQRIRDRRQMTKSAPPERTAMSARTNHAHVTRRRTFLKSAKPTEIAISVEDIYQSAERERLNYSAAIRRQNLAQAQSQTQFFRQGSPISRPNTSASRHIMASNRETSTPFSTWSEPVLSRPSSIVPHPELRHLVETEETSDEDDDMAQRTPMTVTFTSPSRDCCEIIGPQLCYECRKNRIRQVSRERSDYYFPTLEPSEDNLTTAAIVKKYLPGLSEQEVEDKLARGEIARPSVKKQSQSKHVEFSDEEDEVRPKVSNKRVTIAPTEKDMKQKKILSKNSSELFFTNVRDLNYKIITGNADRNVGFKAQPRDKTEKKIEESASSTHFPTFVSPRKVKLVQETHYKTYFEPPLIAKDKQDVEPQFFAGSTGEYTLPEKLPDELVFVDKDGNSVKASSSQGFTAKESAVTEGKPKPVEPLVEAEESIKEKETELEMLNEEEEEEEEEEVFEAQAEKTDEGESSVKRTDNCNETTSNSDNASTKDTRVDSDMDNSNDNDNNTKDISHIKEQECEEPRS